ncbi:MAG: methionyl-tRNA formyltransferase [Clostridium sp.]
MNIVFMGTPEFARKSLEKLIDSKHNILAVVTNEDKKNGRGQKILETPVAILAKEHGIKVLKPKTLKDDKVFNEIKELKPDILIVVAYGKILPKRYLNICKYAPINVHGSLLPKYRGAAPIQWAVINGETETGITTMYLDEKMDTGDILLQEKILIERKDTTKTMFEKLSILGADILVRTLDKIDEIVPQKQNEDDATYAPLIDKQIQNINWNESTEKIFNIVRGLNDFLIAKTKLNNTIFKIFEVEKLTFEEVSNIIGKSLEEILKDDIKTYYISNRRLFIKARDGIIEVIVLQPENKKRMHTKDYLLGNMP